MSADDLWNDMLNEFRALGGVAENIRIGHGPFGRGLFPIDPKKPVSISIPESLLVIGGGYNSGILATGAIAVGRQPAHGTLVAPGLYGPHHQHFFNVRLDVAIDGEENSVFEVDAVPMPFAAENPSGSGPEGGPPVFVIRMSIGPISAVTDSISAGAASRSAESQPYPAAASIS